MVHSAEDFALRAGSERDLPDLVRVDGSFSNEWLLYIERRGGLAEQTIQLRWRKARPAGSRRGYCQGVDPNSSTILDQLVSDLRRSERLIVAEAGGCIAGYLMLAPNWNETAELTAIIVDRAHRRRGIGRRFVQEAESYARERGLRAAQWETQNDNRNAIEFAIAQGFRIAGFQDALYRNRGAEHQLAPDFRGVALSLVKELD